MQNRELAWAGGDPLALKRKSKLPTFKQAAEKAFEANRGRWRSEKTARNWEQGMNKHILPVIGELRIDQVGRAEMLRIPAGRMRRDLMQHAPCKFEISGSRLCD